MTNRNPWLVLTALVIGQVATLLDTTVVNVAIPALTLDLHASIDQVILQPEIGYTLLVGPWGGVDGLAGVRYWHTDAGIDVTEVRKLAEGSQDILRLIRSGECAAVINTPTLGKTVDRDGFLIRRAAVEARVPCLTSLDTALAVVTALRASAITTNVAPLAEYRALEPVATTAAD